MKELSIEQKAKAYDEALEKARQLCAYPTTKPFISDLQDLFPELAESEGEKVRKSLIAIITDFDSLYLQENYSLSREEAIAWLEKHGEQKGTLCDKCKKAQPSHSCQDITALGRCALEKQGEQNPFLDVEIPFGAKDSELEEVCYNIPNGYHAEIEDNKVVIKKGEQKPAEWGEEDKAMMNLIIARLHSHPNVDLEEYSKEYDWLKNKLKSLRPQSTWKPSDEQMEALNNIKVTGCISYAGQGQELDNLYQDLNKLREE